MKHGVSGSLGLLAGTCVPFWMIGMAVGLSGEDIGMFEKSPIWAVPLLAAVVVGFPLISYAERRNRNWLRHVKDAAQNSRAPHFVLMGMGALAGTLAAAVTWGIMWMTATVDMLFTVAILLVFVGFVATYYGTLTAVARVLERRGREVDSE